MTKEEHRLRHVELHKAFDELLAYWLNESNLRPLYRPIRELVDWSHQQTIEPSDREGKCEP